MFNRNHLFSWVLFHYYNLLTFVTKGNKRFIDKKLFFGALIIGISQYACKPKTQDIHTGVKDKDSIRNENISCYDTIAISKTDSINNKVSKTKKEKYTIVTTCYDVNIPTCYEVSMPKISDTDTISLLMYVEQMPEFPGGDDSLKTYLKQNMNYPEMARKNNVEGTVYTSFVVERDGSITDPRILRGIGSGCDDETIRLIKLMPKFNPGKQNGKTVRVQVNLPVKFKL